MKLNVISCLFCIGYRSYIIIIKELSENERSVILLYMIFDILIVFSFPFLTDPLKIVELTTSRIYLVIYLIDITHIDKICELAKN